MYFLILALVVFGEMLLVFSLFVLFEKHGNGKQFLRRSIFRKILTISTLTLLSGHRNFIKNKTQIEKR